jgi:hypothetical protein
MGMRGITPKFVEVMMPSYGADETAERPPIALPDQRERPGRWRDYLAVAVGLLFVTAILFSFRINDWVMHTFAWGD